MLISTCTELETTADDDLHRNDFTRPSCYSVDAAVVALHAVLASADAQFIRTGTYADTQCITVQYARGGRGREELWASGAISADAV